MTLLVKELERTFSFKKGSEVIKLADPDLSMSPDEVMDFYSNQYPELTTSTVFGPEVKEDKVCYEFKPVIGTKG